MKCKICGNEMIVDWVEEVDDTEVFHYKCANPNCPRFGYKKAEEPKNDANSNEE